MSAEPGSNDRLMRVIAETFGMNMNEVDEAASTTTIPAWDSVGQLELVMALEQEFSLSLTPEDILVVDSLKNIRTLLASKGCI